MHQDMQLSTHTMHAHIRTHKTCRHSRKHSIKNRSWRRLSYVVRESLKEVNQLLEEEAPNQEGVERGGNKKKRTTQKI